MLLCCKWGKSAQQTGCAITPPGEHGLQEPSRRMFTADVAVGRADFSDHFFCSHAFFRLDVFNNDCFVFI